MSGFCEHLTAVPMDGVPDAACIDCLAIGGRWVNLRFCVTCETTRCCDSSPHRHARAHWEGTGHPVVRSGEPGESWAWCYDHEMVRRW